MTRMIIPAAVSPPPRPSSPLRPPRQPRPRLSADLIAELAGRLTPRDRWLLAMIAEHQWGRYARPDAYGRWRDDGSGTDFFLEYDTGTEPVARVAAKLRGYAALADATGITTPVLFWFPAPAREASVRAALGAAGVPV